MIQLALAQLWLIDKVELRCGSVGAFLPTLLGLTRDLLPNGTIRKGRKLFRSDIARLSEPCS
jgi:hypothetical protein